ncbi:transposase, partial [Ralstonia pseudosolanacearum]
MNALALDKIHWTEVEFAHLDLGDTRLNKRARILMQRLAAKPTA